MSRIVRGARSSRAALLAIVILLGTGGTSSAAPVVQLHARFTPDRLDTPTTIAFGVTVSDSIAHRVPAPMTEIDISLPAGMGLASSTLGLAECEPARLLELGPRSCPANSRVGKGFALGLIEAEGVVVNEAARVTAVLGPPVGEDEQVLFFAEAVEPVLAELVFSGRVLPSNAARFGARVVTPIPLVPAWPEGPDISIVQFSSTLGPAGITYLRHVRGVEVPFHPRGISVPDRCPRGGFPFAARLMFQGGATVYAHTAVRCPRN